MLYQGCGKIARLHFNQGVKPVLDQLRANLVRLGPALLRTPVKLTPFAIKRQILEQVLGGNFARLLKMENSIFWMIVG